MKKALILGVFILAATSIFAQVELKYGAQRTAKRTDAAMQEWRDHRFGQFVTFGLFSELGGHWKGKYYAYAAEWIQSNAGISQEDYDKVRTNFNPEKFKAKEWAVTAK